MGNRCRLSIPANKPAPTSCQPKPSDAYAGPTAACQAKLSDAYGEPTADGVTTADGPDPPGTAVEPPMRLLTATTAMTTIRQATPKLACHRLGATLPARTRSRAG